MKDKKLECIENCVRSFFTKIGNHKQARVFLLSVHLAMYLVVNIEYEKNVFYVLKVAYQ